MAKPKSGASVSNAYIVFADSLINPYTRKNYEICFDEFKKWLKTLEACNELLTWEPRDLENKIVSWIKELDKNGLATASISLRISAIRIFFIENRAETHINWKWLKARVPKNKGKTKDRDYEKDELVKTLNHTPDVRKRTILLILMSGIRKGAIPDLRYGNITKLTSYYDGRDERKFESYIYKLVVYENDGEYITFLTWEASRALHMYIETRRTAGEKITPNSLLIRDSFNSLNASSAGPITIAALDMLFTRLTRSAGIRTVGEAAERKEVMLFHGIRKYVNHAYVKARVEPAKKELLMGRAAPGREKEYLRATEEELLAEFVRAIPLLTLGAEEGPTSGAVLSSW